MKTAGTAPAARFHPKEEDTVYCTECGCDRILLQNALNTLLQPEQPEPVPAMPSRKHRCAPVQRCRAGRAYPHREQRRPRQRRPAVMPARPAMWSRRPPLRRRWSRWQAGEQTRILDARNYQPAAPRGPAGRRGHPRDARRRAATLPRHRSALRSRSPWTRRTTRRKRTPVTASLRPLSAGFRPSRPSSAQALRCGALCTISLSCKTDSGGGGERFLRFFCCNCYLAPLPGQTPSGRREMSRQRQREDRWTRQSAAGEVLFQIEEVAIW